jgi:hypothetical protein
MMGIKMGFASKAMVGAGLLMLAACSRSGEQKSAEPVGPLCLGVAYDVSRSAQPLPEVTMGHIERILKVLNARGGCIAVALVDESAFRPLTRLKLEPVTGRLDERAEKATRNRKVEKEFLAKVEAMISRPRDAGRTDIKGTLARLTLFFNEPGIPAETEKVLLLVSDGIDTAHWQGTGNNHLPADVAVWVVGMEQGLAEKWFGGQAVLFESPDAAIENLSEGRS